MALDAAPVARITAELMDLLEEEYPDATFEDAIVIVEVSYPHEDGDTVTAGRYRSTAHRASTVLGILELTNDQIRQPHAPDEDGA